MSGWESVAVCAAHCPSDQHTSAQRQLAEVCGGAQQSHVRVRAPARPGSPRPCTWNVYGDGKGVW
eukprot:214364-Chlamydomonas_euryale.AAC.1